MIARQASVVGERLRAARGQATVEFAGMIVWLLLAGVCVWQVALVGWTAVSANNAARTAARQASRGGDGQTAGMHALAAKNLSDHASVDQDETGRWNVSVRVPIIFPGLDPAHMYITESAVMPHTG
jgi:hypothetical protein